MDHEVIWVVPFPDKMMGLNRSGMRQLCFVLDGNDTALNIVDNLKARFLENCFEIHEDNYYNEICRFSFDNETFINNKAYKHIKDDLWLQVTKFQQDPYVGGESYKFIVYKEVKEIPENIKKLSEDQRKLYDRIRSGYQETFLNTKIIGMTEDQLPDDLYITETEYINDKNIARIGYHVIGQDNKHFVTECKIKKQIQTQTDNQINIIEKGQSVKDWLSVDKNRKNLSAITIYPIIVHNKDATNYNKHNRDILIILLNES